MPGKERRRLRLITMAWGEGYIKELFDITLAAALAPGNLPALAPLFDCDMVILTEEGWFERLRQHPAFNRISEYCLVHLRAVDEFITRSDAYGMALTYTLFRGFEDLGDEMVNVNLVFLNSDFVLADGSLRTVAAKILEGERLILAPSYCVVAEDATPRLLEKRDPETWSLVVPPRELAALTIAHRHNTIRGKTINQRVFSLEWIDQFYFLVDRGTMIARQFPIAVVSMRPERVLKDMVTFWDYGIISEACPTAPRCVIADSDEFLMTELRSRETARAQIRLGWPSAKQIAGKLYRFITADPVELSRHTLVVHAGDLPPTLAEARAELDRFVGAVRAFLVAPIDYRNHYIWAYHYPTFQKLRAEYLANRGMRLPVNVDALIEHPPIPSAETLEAAFEAAARDVSADIKPEEISSPATVAARGCAPSLFYDPVVGFAPMLKPYLPDVDPIRRALTGKDRHRVLVVSSEGVTPRLFAGIGKIELRVQDVLSTPGHPPKAGASLSSIGRADRPNTGALSLDTKEWSMASRIRSERRWPLESGQRVSASGRNKWGILRESGFDVCICELSEADLLRSSEIVNAIASGLPTGGSIFLFHWNREMGRLELAEKLVEANALAFDFPSHIYSGRTLDRADAIRLWDSGFAALRGIGIFRQLGGVLQIARAMWSALGVNLRGDAVEFNQLPDACTSVTIELEVTP